MRSESPSVFLPNEILPRGEGLSLRASAESLQVLIAHAADGDVPPRAELRKKAGFAFAFQKPPANDQEQIAEAIKHFATRLVALEKEASGLSSEISELKKVIAKPNAEASKEDLARVIDLTLELNAKLQLIESLTKQLISLTGTSAIISEKDDHLTRPLARLPSRNTTICSAPGD